MYALWEFPQGVFLTFKKENPTVMNRSILKGYYDLLTISNNHEA